jgi:hypothetical protein
MKAICYAPGAMLCMMALPLLLLAAGMQPPPGARQVYEIKVYHYTKPLQARVIDDYLQQVYLPMLHKAGIAKVGVFMPLANDTAADKITYVLVPYKSLEQWHAMAVAPQKDFGPSDPGTAYVNAGYDSQPYTRMESIVLEAFPQAPQLTLPALSGPHEDHIYELRSYESPTEKYNVNKVTMFNDGGEVSIFKRLGFNAVFYAEVLSGSHMPNLMYMTSFDNRQAREDHWKAFGGDAEWNALKGQPRYEHNVSKAEVILCHAAAYSDL